MTTADFLCMSCRKYKNGKSCAPTRLFEKLVCLTCLEAYNKRSAKKEKRTSARYDENFINHLAHIQ